MPTTTERLNFQVGGLEQLSQAGNIVTGIHQGLQLVSEGFELAGRAVGAFVGTGSMFEQYNVQFETLLGSAELAKQRMEELFTFATTTPFELPDVVEAAKSLEAYGIYSERTLRAAGDAAMAFGKDFTETALAIAGASTNEMERLKQFGITTSAITEQLGHDMVRNTKEGLAEITQAVVEIFEGKAGGGMERGAQTLQGMFSMLSDEWTKFSAAVADADVFLTMKGIVSDILSLISSFTEAGTGEQLAAVIGRTIAGVLLTASHKMAEIALGVYDLVISVNAWMARHDVAGKASTVWGGVTAFTSKLWDATLGAAGSYGRIPGGALVPGGQAADDFQGPVWDPVRVALSGHVETTGARLQNYRVGEQGPPWDPNWTPSSGAAGRAGGRTGGAAGPGGDFGWQGAPWDPESLWQGPPTEGAGPTAEYQERAARAQNAMKAGWSSYYRSISEMSASWQKWEHVRLADFVRATRSALAATTADYIRSYAQKQALDQAGTSVGGFLGGMGIVGVGALFAGTISAMITAGQDDPEPYEPDVSDPGVSGTRALMRTAGVRAQSYTTNIYIVHHDPVYYGSGGARELAEDLAPYLRDAIEGVA